MKFDKKKHCKISVNNFFDISKTKTHKFFTGEWKKNICSSHLYKGLLSTVETRRSWDSAIRLTRSGLRSASPVAAW